MKFDFEEFDRASPRPTTQPVVGIQKRGGMSLNQAGFLALGKPKALKFLYDKERRVIGLKAADTNEPNAYPVRKQPNSFNYVFSGQAFLNRYGIPTGQARRYRAEMYGDVLTVDLTQDPISTSWPPKERDELGRIPPSE